MYFWCSGQSMHIITSLVRRKNDKKEKNGRPNNEIEDKGKKKKTEKKNEKNERKRN